MPGIVKAYNDLAVAQYGILIRTLTAITDEELDWKRSGPQNLDGFKRKAGTGNVDDVLR